MNRILIVESEEFRLVDVKFLNRLFPWLAWEDKQKTNLDLASLAFTSLQLGDCTALTHVLSMMPVGSLNTTATSLLIAALGNPEFATVRDLFQGDKACCMSTGAYAKYCKAISTAVRRTSRLPDGTPLDVNQVGAVAYYELAIGRAANLTQWEAEFDKRVGPRLPLTYPGTDTEILDELYHVCSDILAELVPQTERWRPWTEFVRSRKGGPHLVVPAVPGLKLMERKCA
ncbi:Hypothetical protein FKW44_017169 [Caligus rogercresseyi]|uniref:Uncharacterized protein n=1 Tax=Caligus rogercresseyi TaxID=217165 RepID=A0A7T8H2V2_CALRO|nr:Hypothetical protein FKW44_017169 [Caligus rogercresseyi]